MTLVGRRYEIVVAPAAVADMSAIWAYVAENDSPRRADDLLVRIETAIRGLATFAARGNVPPELRGAGRLDMREIHVAPFRIVYGLAGERARVVAVVDARRNVAAFLAERLARG
ncbi:MAG: type II toxin-antitoxin system RelE/ParE family toxin [Tagaea sp.]|nr:type II toxin-antitoxin system RelE/ParE family toxin [Tagaea sp.]